MELIILLPLLIGLGSTSAQIAHCVPCTEPFHDFDYHNACDELRNSTAYIDEYQQPLRVPLLDIRRKIFERKVSFCVPCSESFVSFDANCDDFSRRFLESQRNENTNICKEENDEVFFEGRCQILLEQGTCPENHWLVINNKRNGPVCEYNKCFDSTSLSVNFKGLCLNRNSKDGYKCEEGKVLVLSPDGTADCECSDDEMVKLPYTGECSSTRQKTPECAYNWVLEKSLDGNPVCVRSFCSDDEIYLHGRCWPLSPDCEVGNTITFEPKSSYYNKHENTIRCHKIIFPSIIVPSISHAISDSQNANSIIRCTENAARVDGKCPNFTMREKLPFV